MNAPKSELGISLRTAVVARLLAACIVLLQLANLPAIWFRYASRDFFLRDLYIDLFSVSREANIPTWYSTFALLVCAVLLALVARANRGERDRLHWIGLAALFLLLSLDEACAIHERLGGPVVALVEPRGIFKFAWVIPGMLFAAVVGSAFVPFLRRLPGATRRGFVLAALLYLSGALGMEMASAAYIDRFGPDARYEGLAAIEELLEMSGVAVFLCALLKHLGRSTRAVRLALDQT